MGEFTRYDARHKQVNLKVIRFVNIMIHLPQLIRLSSICFNVQVLFTEKLSEKRAGQKHVEVSSISAATTTRQLLQCTGSQAHGKMKL